MLHPCCRFIPTCSQYALEALEKSAASLEFGAAPLARVVVETDEGKLGAEDVRTIVEGLDPVALVACDAFAAAVEFVADNPID